MNIYGYEAEKDGELLSLAEITVHATIEEIKKLKEFVTFVLSECERCGDDFGHEHLNDFLKEKHISDFIICLKQDG